jgi:hypothetical protein
MFENETPLQFPGAGHWKTNGLLTLATEQQQGQHAHCG